MCHCTLYRWLSYQWCHATNRGYKLKEKDLEHEWHYMSLADENSENGFG